MLRFTTFRDQRKGERCTSLWNIASFALKPGLAALIGKVGRLLKIIKACRSKCSGELLLQGGCTIGQFRTETGAYIQVESPVAACDERVVSISSSETEDQWCPAQKALFRVQARISEGERDTIDAQGIEALVRPTFAAQVDAIYVNRRVKNRWAWPCTGAPAGGTIAR